VEYSWPPRHEKLEFRRRLVAWQIADFSTVEGAAVKEEVGSIL
jgi:hypothetical protein